MKLNVGYLTLRRIERLARLNSYIWENIAPYVAGKDVLEIGSGVGVYTDFLLKAGKNVVSIDAEPHVIKVLTRKYKAAYPSFEAYAMGAEDKALAENIGRRFDSIICLNVLEHVLDDRAALANMSKLLRPDGTLVLLVPAIKFLFGTLDINLEHHRRYSFSEIKEKLRDSGFKVEKHFYIHFAGIFGWFLRSRIIKSGVLNKNDLKIYDSLIPLFRFIDRLVLKRIGQTMIIIAK